MSAVTAVTAAHDEPHAGGHAAGGISNPILGMILFICSEVMFFSGLFAAYFNVRNTASIWPPAEFVGKLRWLPTTEAPIPLVTIATIVLISSSFTCQIGVSAIRRGDRTGLVRAISVTFLMGISFLLMQAYDYSVLYSEGVTLDAGPFGTTYDTLTGFHGAHVFAGVVMLGVVLYRAMSGQFSAKHHDAVEAVSLYWHFVDVVWVGLFSILYVIPTR